MRRHRFHLLATLLAASALAAAHAAFPGAARADDDIIHIWGISTLGETCNGRCGGNYLCCKIVLVQSPPAP